MRPSTQPFLSKRVLFAWEWKIISTSKAEHSFWYSTRNSEMAYSPCSKRVKNWVPPQSFLGSFGAEQHATNLQYYRIPKDPNAPDMYSSVRIIGRRTLNRWFGAVRHVFFVVLSSDPKSLCGYKSYQFPARLKHGQLLLHWRHQLQKNRLFSLICTRTAEWWIT